MKRFTETNKWRDRWFYGLSGKHKLLWLWLCDNCDNCGVVEPCWDMIKNESGFAYTDEDLKAFGERIEALGKGKHILIKFISFQYGNLGHDSKPHAAIRTLLARHGIAYDNAIQRVLIPSSISSKEGLDTLQDKDKDKDNQGIERVQREKGDKARGTEEEMVAYCEQLGYPAKDGRVLFEKWTGSGWRNGGNPIKDWRATVRSWGQQGFLNSQKGNANGAPQAKPTAAQIKASEDEGERLLEEARQRILFPVRIDESIPREVD